MTNELPPKRAAFVQAYASPESPTFGNGVKSAEAAGFTGTYDSLGVTSSRLLRDARVAESTAEALEAAGVTKSSLTRGMKRYFEDEDIRVRPSSVRAGEILMKASGMLQDTTINVDARTAILPGLTPEQIVALMSQATELLSTPDPEKNSEH